MALFLLIALWLIALGSAWLFLSRGWWLPIAASAHAPALDQELVRNFVLLGTLFVAAQVALGFFVWRYRERGANARYTHGNRTAEFVWTLAAAVVFLGLGLKAYGSWAERRMQSPAPTAVQVEVTGVQFQWYFRYPGKDGKFGAVRPELRDAAAGNPLGLDDNDAATRDDVVSGVLLLPAGRDAQLTLRAHDVIHSFFVPTMRVKQDALPGLSIGTHFRPTVLGNHDIACAELCGLGHSRMKAVLRVVPPADFEAWLAARAAEASE